MYTHTHTHTYTCAHIYKHTHTQTHTGYHLLSSGKISHRELVLWVVKSGEEASTVIEGTSLLALLVTLTRGLTVEESLLSDDVLLLLILTLIVTLPERPTME